MKYEEPKYEVVNMEMADVITVSTGLGDGDSLDDF